MGKVYLVKDGMKNVGCIRSRGGEEVKNTDFYLITFNFKTNEGYIEKRKNKLWRLYTQIGQIINSNRYHHFSTLDECKSKLQELNNGNEVIVLKCEEIDKYIK